MKYFLVIIVVVFATPVLAWSVGANPNPITVVQPDGSTLQLRVRGDEWNHWTSTVDGYHIVKNSQGVYEYAQLSRSGILKASGLRASNIGHRSSQELALIDKMTTSQLGPVTANTLTRRAIAAQMVAKNKAASLTSANTGKFKLLVIMANFSDTKSTYESSRFEQSLNQTNYNGTGSLRDYYLENSNGQFDLSSTVTAWVTVPQTHDYYGPEAKWGEFAYQAVKAAYNSGIDLSAFDNNSDGVVDAVAIIHQGNGQEATGDTTDIWSHSWSLSSAGYSSNSRKFGSVKVDNYIVQPELNSNSTRMAEIGVIAHEFGHVLGAYDFYDTDYEENKQQTGTGTWDLMDTGCYNGNPSGSVPAHHNAYTKIQFGWVKSTVLSTAGSMKLPPVISSQQVYRVNTSTANEYYLFENRKKTGFDSKLRGEGMIVYHVDDNYITANGANNALNATDHTAMYIKPANGGLNSADCPFPGASNKVEFHDNTTPSMLAWDGTVTYKSITNIALQNDTVRFNLLSDDYRQIGFLIVNAEGLPIEDATIDCDNFHGVSDKDGLLQLSGDFPPSFLHRYVIKKEGFEDRWGVFTFKSSKVVLVDMIPVATWDTLSVKQSVNGKEISLSWDPVVDEGFNLYTPFLTSFNNWRTIDNDKLPTYTLDEIDYKNEGYTGSFIVFDGYDDSFIANNVAIDSYSGRQFLACVASPPSKSSTKVANDDWLISPEFTVDGDIWLSFYAASLSEKWGLEQLNVFVSSDGSDIADFKNNKLDAIINVPTEWTLYKYNLKAYKGKKIRFALNCVSKDAIMLMVDNIRMSSSEPTANNLVAKSASYAVQSVFHGQSITRNSNSSLKNATSIVTTSSNHGAINYHVYRDGSLIATLNGMGQASFIDEVDDCGLLEYSVVAVDGATNNTTQSQLLSFRNCLTATFVYTENNNESYGLQLPDGVEEATFAIYNMSGQKMGQGQANDFQFQVDLSDFPKGVYTIKIWHLEGTEAIKVYKK